MQLLIEEDGQKHVQRLRTGMERVDREGDLAILVFLNNLIDDPEAVSEHLLRDPSGLAQLLQSKANLPVEGGVQFRGAHRDRL
ncbi:MAG: hypothetical protein AAF098_18900 [Pseudomonadota bacterium]